MSGLRLSFFYAALFLYVGVYMPFFPVWAHFKLLSDEQIATMLAASMMVRVVTGPLVALLADGVGNRRIFIQGMAVISTGATALLLLTDAYLWIFVVHLLLAVTHAPMMPLIESISMRLSISGAFDYGRVRLWGSLAFIASSTSIGWALDLSGAGLIILALVAAGCLTVVASMSLPQESQNEVKSSVALEPSKPSRARKMPFADVGIVVRHPLFLAFFVAMGLAQGSHALYYSFGSLNWQRIGYDSDLIGLLWSIGVASEVLLFLGFSRIAKWFSPVTLFATAGCAVILRWGLMALEPPLVIIIFSQFLHGITFGMAHLGGMHFIARSVPPRFSATLQSLGAAVASGLFMGPLTDLSGPAYERFFSAAYAAMSLLGVIVLVAAFILARRWDGGMIIGEDER
ncbi:MAG: MFS transporter [Parvibaculaceae bacterium]|nr:MFS transporter [Parvibaculaceae bacterium]